MLRACHYIKTGGERCLAAPLREEDFCFWHSPTTQEEAAEARRLGGLRRRKERTLAGAFEFEGLRSIEDVMRLLEIAALDTLSLENSVARNRTLAYLGQTALRCLEVGELEERIRRVEGALLERDLPAPIFDLELQAHAVDEEE